MTLAIVIPVFNEAEAIAGVVSGARRHGPVIVVDDGSTDGSAREATRAGAEVICHDRRRGKAAALRTGFAAARGRGATVVVTLDGDGQHAPDDVPALLRAAHETPDRLVVGNRLAGAADFPRDRLNAMQVAAFFVEWVTGLGMRDTQSGFRAYPMALLDDVGGCREGFVFETEVLIAAARRGWRVREVAVSSIPSARRRSRFRPVRDGLAIGTYLAGQSLARWGRELLGPVRRAGRSPQSPGAGGEDPDQRPPGAGPEGRRRTRAAARATLATPILLGAALVQAGLGHAGVDLVTPLVQWLYAGERLTGPPASPDEPSPPLPSAVDGSFAPSRATPT